MKPAAKPVELAPAFDQKTVHILIRWMIIALAFHFLALSGVRAEEFGLAIRITSLFILSNLVLMFVPGRLFALGWFYFGVVALDLGFVAVAMYFLREAGGLYHWVYIVGLGVLFWRGNLREVLTVLAGGLLLSGAVAYLLEGAWQIAADTGDFLRATILLAVAVFYFFLMGLLDRNAKLFQIVARAKQEWERTADAMSEWVLLVDADGRIRRINRPLAEHLGKTPRELAGQRWYAVLDGREVPFPESPLDRMFQTLAPVGGRYEHARLGCETQAHAIPLFDGGTLVEAIYVLRPVGKS